MKEGLKVCLYRTRPRRARRNGVNKTNYSRSYWTRPLPRNTTVVCFT